MSHTSGAGSGHGQNIPAPKGNLEEYYKMVRRNAKHIQELLDNLKKFVKPHTKRNIYQKHGNMMRGILAKAYANSFRRNVNRIYIKSETQFEKIKVAIGFAVDLSGSMNQVESEDTVTIMSEVFGQWLSDESYAIMLFGSGYQKIKTFFEAYDNTKARIGGIRCLGGTRMTECIRELRLMFNAITDDREKILVVCSDFYLSDIENSSEELRKCLKQGIKIIFMSYGNRTEYHNILAKDRGVSRSYIADIKLVPREFIRCMTEAITGEFSK